MNDNIQAAAGPWHKYPEVKPEKKGRYLIFYEAQGKKIWTSLFYMGEMGWDRLPIPPTIITHWAEIHLPEEESQK